MRGVRPLLPISTDPMAPFDLISAVQGAEGYIALCGIKPGGGIRQVLLQDRDEVDDTIARWNGKYDVYFGVAKFATEDSRKKDNVLNLKAFWLDLDCGPEKAKAAPGERPKGYATKREAAMALASFCEKTNLPEPTTVDSGGGIHCYWILKETITPAHWEAIAAALKAKCLEHNLYADPAVFETARVLRVPGTTNLKRDTPRPVAVKSVSEPVDLTTFAACLGAPVAAPAPVAPRASKLSAAMASGTKDFDPVTFTKIANQCRQVRYCMDNAADLPEPLWRAALSIANKCIDRDAAIAAVSDGHPDYNPAAADKKASLTAGPQSCAQFDSARPKGCVGCPSKGKVNSPIALGTTILDRAVEDDATPKTYEEELYELSQNLPRHYFLRNNGIALEGGDEAGDLLVYDLPLFVVRRFTDDEGIDVLHLRLFTEQDGVRDIMLPVADTVDIIKMRTVLAGRSMVGDAKMYVAIATYFKECVTCLKQKYKADRIVPQFGWMDNDEAFNIGGRVVHKDGSIVQGPPHSATRDFIPKFVPKGSLQDWKRVFNLYNKPGMELYAFAAYTAFGSPLMKFSGESGGIINLYSPKSGTGKSTSLYMCNSVWGKSKELAGGTNDTPNGRVTRLGIFKNLPVTCDELSNMRGEDVSDLAYAVSQGVGKDRMKSNLNELRTNNTTWQTIALCSSNMSFYQRLSALKDAPEGELMRIMEFSMPKLPGVVDEETAQLFASDLRENYGWAGAAYMQHLIPRLPVYIQELKTLQMKLCRDLGLVSRERYWIAMAACNLLGARIAKAAGLIDFDEKRMYKWICARILEMRADVGEPVEVYEELIGRFYNENISRLLVVDSYDGRAKIKPAPTKTPTGTVITMRHEPNENRLYIDRAAFSKFCSDHFIGYKLALRWLRDEGIVTGTAFKTMTTGWTSGGAAINAMVVDTSHKALSMSDAGAAG